MSDLAQARAIALRLPEATEQDHHGSVSFRVRNKIFATSPDDVHLHVMVDVDGIQAAVAEEPAACAELWWGKRLAAVRIVLGAVSDDLLAELLYAAWRRKAPRALAAIFDGEPRI